MSRSPSLVDHLAPGLPGGDAELVARSMSGDMEAREALFRRHLPMATNLAYRLAPNEDPEDIAQDALLEALRSLPQLEHVEAFGAWLRRIIVSKVTQRIRRNSLFRRLGFGRGERVDPDMMISPDAPPDVKLELTQVYALVHQLPAQERVALVLRRVEGLSLDEVATALGLSLATAKRRLAEAETRLESEVLRGSR
jgi:RNA polymerase sigma-70 factor (ECF subfamily)